MRDALDGKESHLVGSYGRERRAWSAGPPSLCGQARSGTLINVKVAKFHPAARDALRAFPEDVSRAFGKAIHDLQLGHSLAMPRSRPMPVLGAGAAEVRIRESAGIYRACEDDQSSRGAYRW